jgi:hypothetical protein
MEKLKRTQLKAGRVIAGVTASTPREAVLLETGLETVETRLCKAVVVHLDTWKHMAEEDHWRRVVEDRVPQRRQK